MLDIYAWKLKNVQISLLFIFTFLNKLIVVLLKCYVNPYNLKINKIVTFSMCIHIKLKTQPQLKHKFSTSTS